MIIQADEYENVGNHNLQDFFDSTEGVFTHTEVKEWASALNEHRLKRLSKPTIDNRLYNEEEKTET